MPSAPSCPMLTRPSTRASCRDHRPSHRPDRPQPVPDPPTVRRRTRGARLAPRTRPGPHGHQVTLFAAAGSDPAPECARLTVRALSRSAAAARPFPPPGAVFESDHHAYVQLMAELADRSATRFDVIHNHSLHQVPIAMAPRLRTPMLSTLHTPPFTWLESAIGATERCGSHGSPRSADTPPPPGGAFVDRVTVVPNGVDVHRWPAGPGGRYLVWSGRITPEKGHTWQSRRQLRSGLRLVLAGPIGNADYFRETIEPTLGERATYAGHLVRSDWQSWSVARPRLWLRRCGTSRTAWSWRRRFVRHSRRGLRTRAAYRRSSTRSAAAS